MSDETPASRRGRLLVAAPALVDPSFRRDVLASGIVEALGRTRADGPGRPAELYRSRSGGFQVLARERRIARAIGR